MKYRRLQDLKVVPKPRQTRSDKWKERPCVMAYRAFADELRLKFGDVPEKAYSLKLQFAIRMPDSWSQKKKTAQEGKAHQQKPDIDNLIKSVMDALFLNDCGIAHVEAIKYWACRDAIDITVSSRG